MALALIALVALTACGSDAEPAEVPAPEPVAELAREVPTESPGLTAIFDALAPPPAAPAAPGS